MLSVIGFLIILGPLVVFHEFGHYFFARLFGVKAEVFSIGFGPKLWSRQIGETEWCLSAIPLGGYVKLLGEDREAKLPEAEQKRALHRQAAWKRFFIFIGGPLFNFILAIFVFMAMLAIGEPQLSNWAGRVVHGSAAEKAGLRSGDRILSVGGRPVKKFEEIITFVSESPNAAIDLQVVHQDQHQPASITVVPTAQSGFSVYGEAKPVGEIDGLSPFARSTVVGISNPESAAAKAGFKTGDEILEMNGAPARNWEEMERIFVRAPAQSQIQFKAKHKDGKNFEAQLSRPDAYQVLDPLGSSWGLNSSELFVEKAVPSSPAEAAGVKSGDRLVGVGNQEVRSFAGLRDAVQKSGEASGKVDLRWERDGKIMAAQIVPTATQVRDPVMKKVTQYTVGVIPMLVNSEPDVYIERTLNPFVLLVKGTERMAILTWRNLVSVWKMITGEVSAKALGGPILIGKIAGESLSRGLISFLGTMGILSIGLGVLNILPVPVLDGGHVALLAVEAIRRKPLTVKQMERIQGVGLVMVLMLMAFVLFNDLTRIASF
jgi:regulator of sigma E protease